MKIEQGPLKEEFSRDLYWIKILFTSDDAKTSQILASASWEYLYRFYKLGQNGKISDANTNDWIKRVIEKWSKLKEEVFNTDTHYDVYATTPDGEARGLEFLLKKN